MYLIQRMKTEKLKKSFTGTGEVKGFKFEQKYEDELCYIYQVNDRYYEVFKKKTVKKCINFIERIFSTNDLKEVYPKAKDFGMSAFTYSKIEQAHDKVKEMHQQENYLKGVRAKKRVTVLT